MWFVSLQKQLKKARVYLGPELEGTVYGSGDSTSAGTAHRRGRHSGRCLRPQGTSQSQSGSREWHMLTLGSSAPFIQSRTSTYGTVLPTFSVGLLTSINLLLAVYAQRFVSMAILNPIELTVKMSHHTSLHCSCQVFCGTAKLWSCFYSSSKLDACLSNHE